MKKKLPIGIQTFREIREENYYYVDKSFFALKLIESGKYYFLSRPRRFGKSLFLDTLKELFEGNEALFRDLYCHDKWDWNKKYPVIRFSFAEGVLKERDELNKRILEQLRYYQKKFGITCESERSAGIFEELLQKIDEKFKSRVVVLVDEYDKPILDNIENPKAALAMREGLKDIYSVIKGADAHIKFAFLTGVSKFSKVSIFSGLNNLQDITILKDYSSICGYTDVDVDTIFSDELEGLDRNKIKEWYNGYNWTGESVYNPFDLLLLFKERIFRPYWFETGTPTFLVKLLLERTEFIPELNKILASETLLSTFDVGNMPIEALLFQTGYLTIASSRQLPGRLEFILTYPNLEVQSSLNDSILQLYSKNASLPVRNISRLYDILMQNDFSSMQALFHSFYASIPHDWYRKNDIAHYEGYYASIFYSYFASLGLEIVVEDSTNKGRIDMSVRFNGHIYLFEFKVVEMTEEGRALDQLKNKRYADKYRSYNEPVHLIGVEFNSTERNIVRFEVEEG